MKIANRFGVRLSNKIQKMLDEKSTTAINTSPQNGSEDYNR